MRDADTLQQVLTSDLRIEATLFCSTSYFRKRLAIFQFSCFTNRLIVPRLRRRLHDNCGWTWRLSECRQCICRRRMTADMIIRPITQSLASLVTPRTAQPGLVAQITVCLPARSVAGHVIPCRPLINLHT